MLDGATVARFEEAHPCFTQTSDTSISEITGTSSADEITVAK
jgi:hypothetical protein